MVCEQLPHTLCAYSVSSTGTRCILEKISAGKDAPEFTCVTSIVRADEFTESIETDDCIKSCGLERMSVGMSSDVLIETQFTQSICSSYCQDNCPNIIDLYTKLAAGEGVLLPELCNGRGSQKRRKLGETAVIAYQSVDTMNAPISLPIWIPIIWAPVAAPAPATAA